MKIIITTILILFSVAAFCQDTTNERKGTFKIKKPENDSLVIRATIAGKSRGEITKGELLAAPGIVAVVDYSASSVDIRYEIASFEMSLIIRGIIVTKSIKGSRLSTDIKQYISNAEKGTKIYFENIRAKGPEGDLIKLPPIIFEIIDLENIDLELEDIIR